jgi:hypothetical protein
MARSPFPTGQFGRGLSDPIYQPNHSNETAASAAGAVGEAAQRFSRELRDMADKAYVEEGRRDAVKAIQAGEMIGAEPRVRTGRGLDDQAYNAIVREQLLARRTTAFGEELTKVELANPDNLAAFGEGAAAVRAAFRPTGDAQLDAALVRSMETQLGAARNRVRSGEEQRRVAIARGAFVEAATSAQTMLGQAIAGVGGVEFEADPTRANAVSAEELARLAGQATVTARMAWIVDAGDQIADPMARRAFTGQVRERWASGDALFAGLDAADMDRLQTRLEADVSRLEVDQAAAREAAATRARDLLEAGEYGGEVDPAELRDAAEKSGDVGLMAQAEFALTHGFDVTPASLRDGRGGSGFNGVIPFLLDELEGGAALGNDNGAGRSQWGITERSHPEAWRDGRVDRAEATRIYRRYWDAIGGDDLPEELAIAAFATAVVAGDEVARQFIEQSGGDVERFLDLEMARFERLAREDPAKYGDDLPGWRQRQGRVRGMIQRTRAQRRAQEGYATDPINFARGNGRRAPLATMPEFDPAHGFALGAEGRDWALTLRERRGVGAALSARDGVPARILSNDEARFYKETLAEDPGLILPLAANVASALGGDGARDFFGELGRAGMAGADLRLASLAIEPRNRNIVQMVVEGRALRAGGAKDATFPEDAETLDEAMRVLGGALTEMPETRVAALSLARDMALADAARGRLGPAAGYVQSALGATQRNGRRFGGTATVNGGLTLAPGWLRADRLEDALEIAAEGWVRAGVGPVYQNGQAIPAQALSTYRLTAEPDGRYSLAHPRTGALLQARSGETFLFDIEAPAFRDLLRRRMPDAVLER